MKLYENAIETERAFIYFDKIMHISWQEIGMGPKGFPPVSKVYEVKIYSNAGIILQTMVTSEYFAFIEAYKRNTHQVIARDVTGIDINGETHGY